jgi:hypothetical protein
MWHIGPRQESSQAAFPPIPPPPPSLLSPFLVTILGLKLIMSEREQKELRFLWFGMDSVKARVEVGWNLICVPKREGEGVYCVHSNLLQKSEKRQRACWCFYRGHSNAKVII